MNAEVHVENKPIRKRSFTTAALVAATLTMLAVLLGGTSPVLAMTVTQCQGCHGTNTASKHHAVAQAKLYDCSHCHPQVYDPGSGVYVPSITRDCTVCHLDQNHERLHSSIAKPADCSQCHNQGNITEHTSRGSDCGTCHANTNATVTKAIADGKAGLPVSCASCHATLNHVQQHDMVGTAATCGSCHALGVLPEHLTRTSTCATCHASTDLNVQGTINLGKSGSQVDCSNCHIGKDHVAQHDAVSANPDCLACHTLSVVAEHTSRTSTCATCHSSTKQAVINTIAAGRAGTPVSCSNCHGAPDHYAQHNALGTTGDCASCHTLSVIGEHLTRGASCATCHSSTNPQVINAIAAGKSGTLVSCVNCHGSYDHSAAHNMATTFGDCALCHSLGTLNEHIARGSTCATCHSSTNTTVKATIAAGKAGTPVNCTNCHGKFDHPTQHAKAVAAPGCAECHTLGVVKEHTTRTSNCATCHSSTNPAVQQTIALGQAGTTVNCANCHGSADHLAQHDKVTAAADCANCHNLGVVKEHTSRTSTCATCHSSAKPEVQNTIALGKAGTAVNCKNCHLTFDHVAQHDHAKVAVDCGQCHTLGVLSEHLTRTSTCATCHSSAKPEVQNAITLGKAGTDVTCKNCHNVNHAAQHDKVSVAASCAQCHTKSVLDEHLTRTSTCSTCHSSSRVSVQDAIAKGKAGQMVTCVDCHGEFSHQAAHDGNVLTPYADCNACHTENLVALHQESGFTCATCHAGTNATINSVVTKGLGGQKVYCADCHTAFGNHEIQHDKIALPTAAKFIATHEEATQTAYCVGCHTSTDAAVKKAINDGMKGTQIQCVTCHSNMSPANVPPVAVAGADTVATVNKPVTLSGAGSTDSDGTIASYAWNFGDGTTGSGVSVSKTYTTVGTYTVTLTVTDNSGATSADTCIVTVQATPVSSTVAASEGLRITGLSSVTGAESGGSKTTITSQLNDTNLTTGYSVGSSSSYRSTTYNVLSVKAAKDALTTSKVVLRIYVSSISNSQTVRIYPYKSDQSNVDSTSPLSFSISGTGWKDLDVTSIASKMNSFGWMKFRVTGGTFSISESNFTIQ